MACLAAPRLGARDDGLHRPAAVPGPLREPLPARLPGALQGLGARDPLVARQPAAADGDLRARLLAALAGHGRHPALPALPALGPGAVDLLLDVARRRRAL